MKVYNGIDIVEIARIRRAAARWGERFLRRIYTEAELERYRHRLPSLAVRFAGKEAVFKLLGDNNTGIGWRDIEILASPQGRPVLNLHGKARDSATVLGLEDISVSLSHSREYAVASVCGVSRQD